MSNMLLTPEQRIRQRYAWFEEAERVGNVTVACRRCGIWRKTFYKWRQRFAESRGARQALLDRSRRLTHVVFVRPAVRSHDTAAAFAKSVNLVLHVNDLAHLPEALKRSREETEQTQRVLLESLRALGKA